ncbi:MAG TPA: response regulator transcription factor [Bacteroidota bacterium]|nr:response regulator transcription factor [Bacteroidota bacterium]
MIEILLADDHALFREGLKQILARHSDLRVAGEAGNGDDVFRKIRERKYDLVVLDISMPGQTGWDVLTGIKAEQPDLPVLILSMHPEDQYAIRMLKAGASGYVSKESVSNELITAIRKVAAGGRHVSPAIAEKLAFEVDRRTEKLPHQLLSNREFQVMSMLAGGSTVGEIAGSLHLSEKTISTYRARLFEKLNVRNIAELTHYAIQHKLIE